MRSEASPLPPPYRGPRSHHGEGGGGGVQPLRSRPGSYTNHVKAYKNHMKPYTNHVKPYTNHIYKQNHIKPYTNHIKPYKLSNPTPKESVWMPFPRLRSSGLGPFADGFRLFAFVVCFLRLRCAASEKC